MSTQDQFITETKPIKNVYPATVLARRYSEAFSGRPSRNPQWDRLKNCCIHGAKVCMNGQV